MNVQQLLASLTGVALRPRANPSHARDADGRLWRSLIGCTDVLCSALVVPWFLTWPFVVLWVASITAGGVVDGAKSLVLGPGDALTTVYFAGAAANTLLVLASQVRSRVLLHPLSAAGRAIDHVRGSRR
jgi:hypothetical protein